MFKNALVSVSNKEGLTDFLLPLQKKYGTRIVSTGGTAEFLKKAGLKVVSVSDQTQFPEVMGGRVKTLHPYIHMGLLCRADHPEDAETLKEHDLDPFDLCIGNLYPFVEGLDQDQSEANMVELIDIGGPSLLRAAAKNFARLTTLCDPSDYSWVLEKVNSLSLEDRKTLSGKVFAHTSSYDTYVANYLSGEEKSFCLSGDLVQSLRYGENPHQQGVWYKNRNEGLHQAVIVQGKELSYNNILDIQSAISTLRNVPGEHCCVMVKHNNPCGVAVATEQSMAIQKAIDADSKSVFGGIAAINQMVDQKGAEILTSLFLECVVAPAYTEEALTVFKKKKNLRVLSWPDFNNKHNQWQTRSIDGGFLAQSSEVLELPWPDLEFIGNTPDSQIKSDMILAWNVCAHLKSNAISIVSHGQTLGMGMGQVNRVDAVAQAISRMREFHKGHSGDFVLASDAFFPFPDSLEIIKEAGISWVIQPGGSIKDEEIKKKAVDLGMNMVLTRKRHFLH